MLQFVAYQHQNGIFFSACQHSDDLSLFGKCFADNNLCPLQNVFVNNKLCFENSKSCFCCSMLPLYFCCKLMWLDHLVLVFVLVLALMLLVVLVLVLVLLVLLVLVVSWCGWITLAKRVGRAGSRLTNYPPTGPTFDRPSNCCRLKAVSLWLIQGHCYWTLWMSSLYWTQNLSTFGCGLVSKFARKRFRVWLSLGSLAAVPQLLACRHRRLDLGCPK